MTISVNKNDNNLYANNNSESAVKENNSDNKTPATEVKPIEVFPAKTPERIRVQLPENNYGFISKLSYYIDKNNIKKEYVENIVSDITNGKNKNYTTLSNDVAEIILKELYNRAKIKETLENKGLNIKETIGVDDVFELDLAMSETYSNILKQCKRKDSKEIKSYINAAVLNEKYEIVSDRELSRYSAEELDSFIAAVKNIETTCNEQEVQQYIIEHKSVVELYQLIQKYNIDLKSYYIDNVKNLSEEECKRLIKQIKKNIEIKNDNQNADLNKLGYDYHISEICRKYDINKSDIIENKENFLEAVKYVEENEIPAGIDAKTAKQHILNYTKALNFQWDCINDFKNFQAKNHEGIRERVKRLYGKKYTKSLIGTQSLYKASQKYFNDLNKWLQEQVITKIKDGHATREEAEKWFEKIYAQNLGKLIINTSGKLDREALKAAAENVKGDLRAQVLDAVFQKIKEDDSVEASQAFADDLQKDGKVYDGLEPEQTANVQKVIVKNQSEQGATETVKANNQNLIENGETLLKLIEICEKIQNNTEITEEEKTLLDSYKAKNGDCSLEQLKKKYDVIIHKNIGGQIGYQMRDDISDERKTTVISSEQKELQEKSKKSYINQQILTEKLIEKSNLPKDEKEKIRQFFNTVSNGNFIKLIENPNAELNPPVQTGDSNSNVEELEVGLPQKSNNIVEANENVQELKQAITEQTQEFEEPKQFVVDGNGSQGTEHSFLNRITGNGQVTANKTETVNALLQNVKAISVVDIKEFSIGLTPLMKQFSELSTSVQNHIKSRLEARSEEEQIQNIDQMDRNSDKIDLALQLKISSDKLKELHLDTNARKSLELQEEMA